MRFHPMQRSRASDAPADQGSFLVFQSGSRFCGAHASAAPRPGHGSQPHPVAGLHNRFPSGPPARAVLFRAVISAPASHAGDLSSAAVIAATSAFDAGGDALALVDASFPKSSNAGGNGGRRTVPVACSPPSPLQTWPAKHAAPQGWSPNGCRPTAPIGRHQCPEFFLEPKCGRATIRTTLPLKKRGGHLSKNQNRETAFAAVRRPHQPSPAWCRGFMVWTP